MPTHKKLLLALSLFLLSLLGFNSIANAATLTLGNTTIGSSTDTSDSNFMNGSIFTMGTSNGTVSSMTVYVARVGSAPNNLFQVGIYTDNNGTPGTLIAKSRTQALVANSWNTIPITATLTSSKKYWLMYNTNGRRSTVNNMKYNNLGSSAWSSSSTQFGTWPTTFGSSTPQTATFSIYATYSTDGTVPPTPTQPTPTPTQPTPTKIPTPTPTKVPTPTIATQSPTPTLTQPTPTPSACPINPTSPNFVIMSATTTTSGNFKIWSRIMGSGDNANSYYLQVDNNCALIVGDLPGMPANQWTWVDYKDGTPSNKITMNLTQGTHIIKLIEKEPGLKIDRLLLTTDQACLPTGVGTNCDEVVATPTSTPVPTTSPSPSVPVSQNINCASRPSACGFADETNTGILPGVTLTKVPSQATSGPGWEYVTSPNRQINITGSVGTATTGLELEDGVEAYVYGSDITIRNLKLLGIHGQSADGITVLATTNNVKIEYCDITGAADNAGTVSATRGWNAIHIKNGASNYTVNNCHIRGFSGGIFPEQEKGVNTFIGNYIHHMVSIDNNLTDHCNVFGNGGGPDDLTSKQLIKDNTFWGDHPVCMSSTISLFPDGNAQTNQHTVIEHNLLSCGGYYCINPGYGNAFGSAGRSYIAFKNNHWTTKNNPNGGYNGVSYVYPLDASSGAGNYQCANIWDDGPLAGSGADQDNAYPAPRQPVTSCPVPAPW